MVVDGRREALPVRVVALYRFTPFGDVVGVRASLAKACCAAGVRGTLLVAHEGINGTIAGTDDAIDGVLAHIRALPGCTTLEVKESRAATLPFHRMKVRIKREIVTMGQPDVDPLAGTGHYVPPADWNALIAEPGTILIDTRNDYEVAIGSFAGAIDPGTRRFGDFPAWFREQRAALEAAGGPQAKFALFCTGGIRCEKATAFLKAEGVEAVYHLDGGILKYLETVPAEDSLWRGECFVFDQRVAVGQGLAPGSHALCHACHRAVGPAERASPLWREGVSCPACHGERDEAARAGLAERQRQVDLAAARGQSHIGPPPAISRRGVSG